MTTRRSDFKSTLTLTCSPCGPCGPISPWGPWSPLSPEIETESYELRVKWDARTFFADGSDLADLNEHDRVDSLLSPIRSHTSPVSPFSPVCPCGPCLPSIPFSPSKDRVSSMHGIDLRCRLDLPCHLWFHRDPSLLLHHRYPSVQFRQWVQSVQEHQSDPNHVHEERNIMPEFCRHPALTAYCITFWALHTRFSDAPLI